MKTPPRLRRPHFSLPLALRLTLWLLPVFGALAQLSLTRQPSPNDFVLFDGHDAAPICVETNNDRAVLRAAGDLADDIERVTGVKSEIRRTPGLAKFAIIAGTLGGNQTIDALTTAGKLDVTGVRGQWESYAVQIVQNPLPGVEKALVIAGSDRRGAIFGLYQLSEWIGVSPWYWWADVPVARKNLIAFQNGNFKQGPPAVKYRGIFLNDEDWGLRPWAAQTFDPETGNIGPKTYAKVFELLLRLRANYIWPAMHPDTRAFNFFPTNKEMADTYGIVMGSSHCEQMLRDNVDEWKTAQNGEYNYVINRDGVLKYWEERVRENGKYDNVYTVAMRGIHDGAMPGGGTAAEKADRMRAIIQDQRGLLSHWVNTNLSLVPQIFCPYKEVLELYHLAPDIPDDITLVWPDDNYGYIRQFSNSRERQRTGGAGVYYHVSYYGRPQDYLWLCSTPPALIGEEMSKAFDYGANQVWILNVGDLKPAEKEIEFFLQLAWNPHSWNATNADALLQRNLARDFGAEYAGEISSMLSAYYRLNFQRKTEHMGFTQNSPFSISAAGDEVEQRLAAWRELVQRDLALSEKLPAELHDAYFELVDYPIRGAQAMNEKWLNLTKYYAYARQGRVSAPQFFVNAQDAQVAMHGLTYTYNNRTAGGKWRNIISDHPRDQAVFEMPKFTAPVVPASSAKFGIAVEGLNPPFWSHANDIVAVEAMPEFNPLTRRSYSMDVFNAGPAPFQWTAKPSAPWIHLSRENGGDNDRVWISLDWARMPTNSDIRGAIQFNSGDQQIMVAVTAAAPSQTDADFVEDNNSVIIQAEHASAFLPGKDAQWEIIHGLGYNSNVVSVFPATVSVRAEPEKILAESPCLQYKIGLAHPDDWTFTVRALPTFSVETGRPQRFALALDTNTPKIISLPVAMSETDRHWQENVLRNAALASSVQTLTAGPHTLKIWMVDPGIVIDAIAASRPGNLDPGYLWPLETRRLKK